MQRSILRSFNQSICIEQIKGRLLLLRPCRSEFPRNLRSIASSLLRFALLLSCYRVIFDYACRCAEVSSLRDTCRNTGDGSDALTPLSGLRKIDHAAGGGAGK